jgi:adenosylmethionine-8-amino-7-oxononanoate aminotransferase
MVRPAKSWGWTIVKAFWTVLALAASLASLGACQLPTNVAIKRVDSLRAELDACLKNNIAQFDDRTSDARQVGQYVAMSCSVQTEKLTQYAVPYATRQEYEAFQRDAYARAVSYVTIARGSTPG